MQYLGISTSIDNIAYNIAGNNADIKVDISDSSATYDIARIGISVPIYTVFRKNNITTNFTNIFRAGIYVNFTKIV